MARRFALLSLIAVCITIFVFFNPYGAAPSIKGLSAAKLSGASYSVPQNLLDGKAIAPKLGNETIKAELGRAAWRVLHTTFARFPDKPTPEERESLRAYIHLFQKLYPCGECAAHFGKLLQEFPPQVSSRSAAAVWGCHVHNKVNERLGKELFDCSKIGAFYDCGCADGKGEDGKKEKKVEERGAE